MKYIIYNIIYYIFNDILYIYINKYSINIHLNIKKIDV